MQQPIVLQSSPFGDGNPPQKSKAESEASQRTHLKPSEAKVGDMFYRFENHVVSAGVDEFDESLGSRMELYCVQYQVVKVTEKGARITDCAIERPVLDHYINKYAYPSGSLVDDFKVPYHGIVDPFLPRGPDTGETFWFVMAPRMVQSLRHVWEHPDFPPGE